MILLDTSVLIAIYRRQADELGQRMADIIYDGQACICGPVWVEYVGGFRSDRRRREVAKDLWPLPWLETSGAAYRLAAEYRATWPALGTADAIIAATAITNKAKLLTVDADFKPLEKYGVEVLTLR